MLSISVVVPVHRGGASFRRCLKALSQAVGPADEIVVVADGETEGIEHQTATYGAHLVRSRGPDHAAHGPAHARNCGAEAAGGDVLFFVDADVVVPEGAVDHVRSVFEGSPDLAALIGSYDDTPGAEGFISQYRNLLHHHTHQTAPSEEVSTFWGACGAVRRTAFMEVGGFNEQYGPPSIEDIEFGSRLRRAGYRIRLRKSLQVQHLKEWTARSMIYTDVFRRGIPWTKLMLRRGKLDSNLNGRLSGRLSVVTVFLFAAALVGAWWAPALLLVALVLGAFFVALNSSFYRLLLRKHGLLFTARAIAWHGLYYAYSGVAFVLGTARHFYRSLRTRDTLESEPRPPVTP